MKKWLMWALCFVLILGMGIAQANEIMTMQDIRNANDFETVYSAEGSIGMTIILYSEDGSDIVSYYSWIGQGPSGDRMFVNEGSDGSVNITEGGKGYGLDAETMQLFTVGFMGGQYDSFLSSSTGIFEIDAFEKETTIDVKEADGQKTVTASCEDLGENYEVQTVVDAVSMRVLSQQCSAVSEDGSSTLIWRSSYTYGQSYVIDDTFKAMWNEPLHSLRIIDKTTGMNDEQTVFTASQGVKLIVNLPESYSTFYTDEACTEPYVEKDEDMVQDLTLYIKVEES